MSAGPRRQRATAPIYGVVCVSCGAAMTRGPSDPDLCAGCQRDHERLGVSVQR